MSQHVQVHPPVILRLSVLCLPLLCVGVFVCVVYQLDDTAGVRRRPPARLESLRAKKEQSLPSREEIEEKIRLAEERRKVQGLYVCVCHHVPEHLSSSPPSPSHI